MLDGALNTLSQTWLGDAARLVVANLQFVGVLLVVAGILGTVVYSFLFVSKGGGQLGIIEGYVGTIGAGKTTLAVQHALSLARARDAVVMSNIPVRCNADCLGSDVPEEVFAFSEAVKRRTWVRGNPHCELRHRTLPMTDDGIDLGVLLREAFRLRDANRGLVLLMDEVGVVMPARLWREFPVGLMWLLQQSRKLTCEWIWTAQDASFVDHQLRSLSACVWYVRSFPPPSVWRRVKGKRPWLLRATAFSASMAIRANGEGIRPERKIAGRWHRYRRSWEQAFDTDGVVLPSRHIKGVEVLREAVKGDRHVVDAAGGFGVGMGGSSGSDVPLAEVAQEV